MLQRSAILFRMAKTIKQKPDDRNIGILPEMYPRSQIQTRARTVRKELNKTKSNSEEKEEENEQRSLKSKGLS